MSTRKPLCACVPQGRSRQPMKTETACALVALVACLAALACCGVPRGPVKPFPRIELGE